VTRMRIVAAYLLDKQHAFRGVAVGRRRRNRILFASIFDDPDHSDHERRELIIGHSARQRLLVVSFTEPDRRTRIIGARKATPIERQDYEKNKKTESST